MGHLQALYTFNTKEELILKGSDGGVVGVFDNSGSMNDVKDEMRVAISAFLCITNTDQRLVHMKTPKGKTYLVSCMERIVKDLPPSTRVFLLTDGDDTETSRTSIPVNVDSNGDLLYREIHTTGERRSAVMDFLENVALCDVHVLGIGNEVKDLVTALSKKRMVVGHVDRGINTRQMIGVVQTVMDGKPTGELITLESPNLIFPSDDVQVKIETIGKNVVVSDGDTVDASALDLMLQQCEQTLSLPACKYTRAVMAWYLCELKRRGPLPGALIGGKRTRVFPGPEDRRRWSSDVNALLSKMSERPCLTSLGKQDEAIVKVGEKTFSYSKTPMYDVPSSVPLIVLEELATRYSTESFHHCKKAKSSTACV